jgi:hypothetical protein
VDDLMESDLTEQLIERSTVRYVPLNEHEGLVQGLDFAQVLLFEGGVVKRIQIVESPDCMAHLQQTLAEVRSNETRAAGDQKIHSRDASKCSSKSKSKVQQGLAVKLEP